MALNYTGIFPRAKLLQMPMNCELQIRWKQRKLQAVMSG
jgi:hypothetical protein